MLSQEMQEHIANTNDTVRYTLMAAIQALTLAQETSSRNHDAMVVMLGALNENIEMLIEQTKQTTTLIRSERKLNRFQSASHHCHVGAFDYWEGGKRVHSSKILVQRIFTSFFNGKAHALRSSCHTGSHNCKGASVENGWKEFPKKLVERIEALIGHKVQLLDKGDDILHVVCLL